MKVLYVSYEVAPIYKFGGLGDVAGSLPKALASFGIDIRIAMPGYPSIKQVPQLPNTKIPIIYVTGKPLEATGIIGKNKTPRNRLRAFAYFSSQLLIDIKKKGFAPDIIHLNEWHAGLVPLLLKKQKDLFFAHTKTLVTLHNSLLQGIFLMKDLNNFFTRDIMQYIDNPHHEFINLSELSLKYADWITTVSPHFADEIKSKKFDFGLAKYLIPKGKHFEGILNGIDYSIWNSNNDPYIHFPYTKESVNQKKIKNKEWFQRDFGLPIDSTIPLFSFIARISWQKGVDLLISVLRQIQKLPLQCVVIGVGDKEIALTLNKIVKKNPKQLAFFNQYNEHEAHQAFASSDFFLMPSIFEPCGLTQMMGMAYGTIPLVTDVGGLHDTVIDNKTGFFIKEYTSQALLNTLYKSLKLWQNKEKLYTMRHNVMSMDFSWNKSAHAYLKIYKSLINKRLKR